MGARRTGWWSCLVLLVLAGACQSAPWKLMRTINPNRSTQGNRPYQINQRVSGVRLHIQKFYTTPRLACAALEIDNRKGYSQAYVDPGKTKLVCGKYGAWSLKPTAAAREPLVQKMAQDFFRIVNPGKVSRWSRYMLSKGSIPLHKARKGLICFSLRNTPDDPQALVTNERCRLRLTDLRVANGRVRANWMWLEAL